MPHDQLGGEVVLDDERTEHRLADDAEWQQRAEHRQCQRNGRRRQARTLAAITARPTNPVSSRLPYSISAWNSTGAITRP